MENKKIKIGDSVWVCNTEVSGRGTVTAISKKGKCLTINICGEIYKKIYLKDVSLWD